MVEGPNHVVTIQLPRNKLPHTNSTGLRLTVPTRWGQLQCRVFDLPAVPSEYYH